LGSDYLKRGDLLYEGKAKKVFSTENEKLFIVEFKDDATAFNGRKKGTISQKGIMNNAISSHFFKLLESRGIKTHFVKKLSDREMLVKAVKIFQLEVVVRNIAAGGLASRLGLEEGVELISPILELYYKNDALGDPMINNYHVMALGLANPEELKTIEQMAFKINEILKSYLLEKGILLVDFKLEFGKADGEILLADEISPDTCRFWDKDTKEKLDKDRFRRDLGNVEGAYREVILRLNLGKED